MKKRNVILGMAVLVAFAFAFALVLAGCDDGTDDNSSVSFFRLALSAVDGSSNRHILPVTITNDNLAKALVSDGKYPYSIDFGGVVISKGTVTVNNGLYTFTPETGSVFTYNENTDASTGSITVSAAAKAAIQAGAGGIVIGVPDTLTVDKVIETKSGGNTWDGIWRRVKSDNNTFEISWDDSDQQIVFSGNKYTLKYGDEIFETGTFLYCHPDGVSSDSLFIFSRNNKEPKIVTYLWEGKTEHEVDNPAFIELYNWLWDAMEIAVHSSEDFDSRMFYKLPFFFN